MKRTKLGACRAALSSTETSGLFGECLNSRKDTHFSLFFENLGETSVMSNCQKIGIGHFKKVCGGICPLYHHSNTLNKSICSGCVHKRFFFCLLSEWVSSSSFLVHIHLLQHAHTSHVTCHML